MTATGQNRELVAAILKMGQDLGLEVIAEGIESDEQRDSLLALHCVLGQGFTFSRPLDGEAVLDLLEGLAAARD